MTAACKRVGCNGVVHFKGKHPKMNSHTVLTAARPEWQPWRQKQSQKGWMAD